MRLISVSNMDSYPLLCETVICCKLLVYPLVLECVQFVSSQTDGSSELLHFWSVVQNSNRGIWSTQVTFIPHWNTLQPVSSSSFHQIDDGYTTERDRWWRRWRRWRKIWEEGKELWRKWSVWRSQWGGDEIQVRVYKRVGVCGASKSFSKG